MGNDRKKAITNPVSNALLLHIRHRANIKQRICRRFNQGYYQMDLEAEANPLAKAK